LINANRFILYTPSPSEICDLEYEIEKMSCKDIVRMKTDIE